MQEGIKGDGELEDLLGNTINKWSKELETANNKSEKKE
jgi:hypothetical protein